jgi:hypothetical protein
LVLSGGLDLVAAGYALLENFGVIEGVPALLLVDGELAVALHFHVFCAPGSLFKQV